MIEHNFETKICECDIADSEVLFLLQLAGAFSSGLSDVIMLPHWLVLSWGREAPSDPFKLSGRKLVPVACVSGQNPTFRAGCAWAREKAGCLLFSIILCVCYTYEKPLKLKLAPNERALSGIAWKYHFIREFKDSNFVS